MSETDEQNRALRPGCLCVDQSECEGAGVEEGDLHSYCVADNPYADLSFEALLVAATQLARTGGTSSTKNP